MLGLRIVRLTSLVHLNKVFKVVIFVEFIFVHSVTFLTNIKNIIRIQEPYAHDIHFFNHFDLQSIRRHLKVQIQQPILQMVKMVVAIRHLIKTSHKMRMILTKQHLYTLCNENPLFDLENHVYVAIIRDFTIISLRNVTKNKRYNIMIRFYIEIVAASANH